jgi:uncharacterized protein with HEPN domain
VSPDRSGREWHLFLADMREFCRRIADYIEGRSQEDLFAEQMRLDAVLRNLELLGEAAKRIPPDIQQRHPEIPWRRVAGLRDVLAHAYFGLDEATLWQTVSESVPALDHQLAELEQTTALPAEEKPPEPHGI